MEDVAADFCCAASVGVASPAGWSHAASRVRVAAAAARTVVLKRICLLPRKKELEVRCVTRTGESGSAGRRLGSHAPGGRRGAAGYEKRAPHCRSELLVRDGWERLVEAKNPYVYPAAVVQDGMIRGSRF